MDTDVSSSPPPPFPQSEPHEDYQSFMETIKPPYPPRLKPQDLLPKLHDGKLRKIPNAFITYRKEFCSNLKTKNICLTMSDASFWASKLWYKESTKVRMTYQNLTMQAKVINEKMAKSPRKPGVKNNSAELQDRSSTLHNADHNVSTGIPMYMQGAMQTAEEETFDRYRLLCPSFSTAEQSSSMAPQLYQNSTNPLYVPPTSQVDYCDSPSLYLPPLYFSSPHFLYDAQQTLPTSEETELERKIQETCGLYYPQQPYWDYETINKNRPK